MGIITSSEFDIELVILSDTGSPPSFCKVVCESDSVSILYEQGTRGKKDFSLRRGTLLAVRYITRTLAVIIIHGLHNGLVFPWETMSTLCPCSATFAVLGWSWAVSKQTRPFNTRLQRLRLEEAYGPLSRAVVRQFYEVPRC